MKFDALMIDFNGTIAAGQPRVGAVEPTGVSADPAG